MIEYIVRAFLSSKSSKFYSGEKLISRKKKSSTTPDFPLYYLSSGHLWEVKCKDKFRKIGHTTRFQSRDKAHSAVSDPNTINHAEKIENIPKQNERTKSKIFRRRRQNRRLPAHFEWAVYSAIAKNLSFFSAQEKYLHCNLC